MEEYGRIYKNGKFEHKIPYMSIGYEINHIHSAGLSHGRWVETKNYTQYAILSFYFHGRNYGQIVHYSKSGK